MIPNLENQIFSRINDEPIPVLIRAQLRILRIAALLIVTVAGAGPETGHHCSTIEEFARCHYSPISRSYPGSLDVQLPSYGGSRTDYGLGRDYAIATEIEIGFVPVPGFDFEIDSDVEPGIDGDFGFVTDFGVELALGFDVALGFHLAIDFGVVFGFDVALGFDLAIDLDVDPAFVPLQKVKESTPSRRYSIPRLWTVRGM